jgi:hypothetical protein
VFASGILYLLIILTPSNALAVYFSRENWDTMPHPEVKSFTRDSEGRWSGTTIDGKTFTQYPILNEFNLRIERFEIDGYYHYVVEGEIMYTLQELSVSLAPQNTDLHV